MDEEIRFVHREETFTDLAVRELAKTQASCLCKIQGKRCTRAECRKCQVKAQLDKCKASMNDYDLTRLRNYTGQYYTDYSDNIMGWMNHKEYKRFYSLTLLRILLGFILLTAVFGALFLAMGCTPRMPNDSPPDPHYYDDMITRTVQKTQRSLSDVNQDGEVNCIDAAIIFKVIWDNDYPSMPNKCQIAHNVNPGKKMNHLFVYIWNESGQRMDIEPRAPNPYRFDMKYNWGEDYDPKYNRYGETDWWLGQRR